VGLLCHFVNCADGRRLVLIKYLMREAISRQTKAISMQSEAISMQSKAEGEFVVIKYHRP
jgi:hypothetical protein